MGQTPQPQPAFREHRKVRKQVFPLTIEQALADAEAAGFRQTAKSRPGAAYVQRKWNEGATIRPVPDGVVVQPAWTSGQIYGVVAVLAVFLVLAVCPMGGALFAA